LTLGAICTLGSSELRRMTEGIVDKEANKNNFGTRAMKASLKHPKHSEQHIFPAMMVEVPNSTLPRILLDSPGYDR